MTKDAAWRSNCLLQLHSMLRQITEEREAVAAENPDKAGHLADAAADLQTLIDRFGQASPIDDRAAAAFPVQLETERPDTRENRIGVTSSQSGSTSEYE